MTYVEKNQLDGRYVAVPAQQPWRGTTMRIVIEILAWPLHAWRNRNDLNELAQMDRRELRDIGLTPADVVATKYAPFHVGATIMLAHLAEQNRRSAATIIADGETARDGRREATAKQESGQ